MIAQPEPSTGQITGPQSRGRADIAGIMPCNPGFDPTPKPSIKFYRQMRKSPTIRVARAASFMPVKAAQWSFEPQENGTQAMADEIDKMMRPLRNRFLHDISYALDYGYAAWEIVWQAEGSRWTIKKLKPLLADITRPLVLKTTGEWMGVANGEAKLDSDKSAWYVYNPEAGDLFGEPRNETVRETFWHWKQTMDRLGKLVVKVTGTIPMVRYPEGRSLDADGGKEDNFDLAHKLIYHLANGRGVALPDTLAKWAEEYIQMGGDPTKVKAWMIEFLESSSGHVQELLGLLQHLESLMVRGWLVPERAVLEATTAGSRADSGTAADLSMLIAEDLADDIADWFSHSIIDKVLYLNYGPDAVGGVRVKHEPIDTREKNYIRNLIKDVLTTPVGEDLARRVLDYDQMLTQADIPVRDESASDVLDDSDGREDQEMIRQLTQRMQQMGQPPANPAPPTPPMPTDSGAPNATNDGDS